MNRDFLIIEQSAWWIPTLLVLSGGLSYFLYVKKGVPWSSSKNWLLFAIRTIAIFLLSFLFLDPSIRQIINDTEPPLVAIAVDNSESVLYKSSEEAITNNLSRIENSLKEANFNAEVFALSEYDSLTFEEKTTNLSGLFKQLEAKTSGKHLVATVLISDGIHNLGRSPRYLQYLYPIFSVGLGDTIPPQDISITRVRFNKVTYKGNESPVKVELAQEGYQNRSVAVHLYEKGQLVGQEEVTLTGVIQEVDFTLTSEEEGLRHLTVQVELLENEAITTNNRKDIYLEVIDGRKKVLFVSTAPHPDIKAIRSTLEATGNYQSFLYIPRVTKEVPNEVFDVVVFHNAFTRPVSLQLREQPGEFFILSNRSSKPSINEWLPHLGFTSQGNQPDKVTGALNSNFSKFQLEDYETGDFPPMEVPYGNYEVNGPVETLLYQRIGSVTTDKPLLSFYDDKQSKKAVLMGLNIWKWKMQETAINGNSSQFDQLITKSIQYLAVKQTNERFRFDVEKSSYTSVESVVFNSEVYNDIYERIYGNSMHLTLRHEDGSTLEYDLTDSEFSSTFKIPSLKAGIYTFRAEVTMGTKRFTDAGEFLITSINPEMTSLTADHELLKSLSNKTGGQYRHFTEAQAIVEAIVSRDFKPIIRSNEHTTPLYTAWWYVLAIFLLFTFEWGLRKYWGGY